jgi:hypothetical protein
MDWLFQTGWEAANKEKNYLALIIHSPVYTLGFSPVFYWYKISLIWLVFLFISHAVLDNRKFERWFIRIFKGRREDVRRPDESNILLLAVDQVLHLVVLALIVILANV